MGPRRSRRAQPPAGRSPPAGAQPPAAPAPRCRFRQGSFDVQVGASQSHQHLDGHDHAHLGPSLRRTQPLPRSRVHPRRGAHPRPRHRRQHRDLQRRSRRVARPLPHRDGERLVYLRHSINGPGGENVELLGPRDQRLPRERQEPRRHRRVLGDDLHIAGEAGRGSHDRRPRHRQLLQRHGALRRRGSLARPTPTTASTSRRSWC